MEERIFELLSVDCFVYEYLLGAVVRYTEVLVSFGRVPRAYQGYGVYLGSYLDRLGNDELHP